MKASIQFATGLILAAGALLASGSIARAGEGGASGSVSIDFATATVAARQGLVTSQTTVQGGVSVTSLVVTDPTNNTTQAYTGPALAGAQGDIPGTGGTFNNVSNLSSSIAVGKTGAFSSAISDGNGANTSAIGSAGQLNITNPNTITAKYESLEETAANRAIEQRNELSSGGTITGTTGTVSIP
jgi:hypothetical protein